MKNTIEMLSIEMNKSIVNVRKIQFVMKVESQIDKAFDIVKKCRKNISDQKIRNLEKRALLLAENALKKRSELLSDSLFDDIRESYAKHEKTCLALIKLYREELSLYD